ncbi:MAG: hypothetical protein ABWZ15_13875 [Acidimicrobiia bacterium]|jgi:hypothetical protein
MWARLVIAVALLAIGVVWFFQGIGVIEGSFMTGEALWAVIGAISILIAVALLVGVRRERRRRADPDS